MIIPQLPELQLIVDVFIDCISKDVGVIVSMVDHDTGHTRPDQRE